MLSTKRLLPTLATLIATCALADAAVISTAWIGPDNGGWMEPSNWSAGVPNNTSTVNYNATISQNTVNLYQETISVQNLNVTGDAHLYLSALNSPSCLLTVTGTANITGTIDSDARSDIRIEGTLLQQSGHTLTQGNFFVSTAGGFISWKDADIEILGSDAGISLSTGDSLRDLNGASALRNLRTINGDAFINNFTSTGDLTIGSTGRFSGDLHIPSAFNFQSDGILELDFNHTVTVGGNANFGSSSIFLFHPNGSMNVQGSASLDGKLQLSWNSSVPPSFSDEFVVLQAGSINGTFNDGSRAEVISEVGGEHLLGSFEIEYGTTSLTLKNFQAIPEPTTLVLLGLGLAGAFVFRRHCKNSLAEPSTLLRPGEDMVGLAAAFQIAQDESRPGEGKKK